MVKKSDFPPEKNKFWNFFAKVCLYRSNCSASKHADFEVKIFRKIFVLSEKKKTYYFSMVKKSNFPPEKNNFWKFFAKVCLYRSNSSASQHADFEVKIFSDSQKWVSVKYTFFWLVAVHKQGAGVQPLQEGGFRGSPLESTMTQLSFRSESSSISRGKRRPSTTKICILVKDLITT